MFKIIALITEKDSMEILRTMSLVGIVLLLVACKDAKVKVTSNKSSTKIQFKASGQNPINASSIGAVVGTTTPNTYKVQIKVGGAAIPSTLTNSGAGNYRVYTKVVAQ